MIIDVIKMPFGQASPVISSNLNEVWILRCAKAIVHRVARIFQARKDRKMLLSMSDSMLKDIGISRCDIDRITKRLD